jgi:putative phosphoribosyl transferase
MKMFADRLEAARELADALSFLQGEDLVVIAIPNGGVVVAEVICDRLHAPMDVLLLTELAAPRTPDHIVGAVDEFGQISLNESVARWHHITTQKMIGPARVAFEAMQRRRARFRALVPELEIRGKTALIISDGVDDGAAMLGAVASCRKRGAAKVVAAAPVGYEKATWSLHETANMVVIPHHPANLKGIHKAFRNFPEIDDGLALDLLRRHLAGRGVEALKVHSIALGFLVGDRSVYAEAEVPPLPGPWPAVIFAHGRESHCRSLRALPVSFRLAKRGVMGVRIDFNGHGKSEAAADGCTMDSMIDDLRAVFENLRCDDRIDPNAIGVCGAGMGAQAALRFAAKEDRIAAVAVRGPILDGDTRFASKINAPTIVLHAERDSALAADALELDQKLGALHELHRIPDCTRLFDDPISRELMVSASADFLSHYLHLAQFTGASASQGAAAGREPEPAGA